MTPAAVPEGERSTGVIAWFVRNRVAANLVFFGICLAGYLAIGQVPHELMPETASVGVRVQVALPGATAEEVEQRVLIGLEESLRGIPGVSEMNGLATDNAAMLMLLLEAGTDVRGVSDTTRERLVSLATLPADAEDPVVSEIRALREILRIAVHGEADERSLREAARLVQDAAAAVPGVMSVERITGRDYEMTIEIPEANLTRFGLTFDQVAAAVRQATVEVPAGNIRSGTRDVGLRTEGTALLATDFSRIPLVEAPDGGVLRVGDIGAVHDGFDRSGRAAWMDGAPAVLLQVNLAQGARLGETTGRVVEAVRTVRLPEGIEATPWYFASESFDNRLDLMVKNGMAGLGLIFLVLFFTLSTRLAVWTAAGLPFAFFGAFLLMPGLGVTVNLISMFGFIMALGVVVDDAIVVGENVQRQVGAGNLEIDEAAIRGTRQVLFPAAFGVFTTMAAFTPLIAIPGAYGEMVADLPRIVIPILAFSLVEAAWILPHHLAYGGLRVRPSRRLARIRGFCQSAFDTASQSYYRPALRWALENRLATLAVGFFALCLAMGLTAGGWVPVAVGTPVEANYVVVQIAAPPGVPPDLTRETVLQVDALLEEVRDEIRADTGVDVERNRAVLVGQQFPLGVGEAFGGQAAAAQAGIGQIIWQLVPAEDRLATTTRNAADRLRERFRRASMDAEVSVVTDSFGQQADISIRITGPDFDRLRNAASLLEASLGEAGGVTAVWNDLEGEADGIVARLRTDSAGAGIGAAALGGQLRQAFHGEEIRRLQRGRDELRVVLRAPEAEASTGWDLASRLVRRPDGGVAPLGRIAEISREEGQSVIRRMDSSRAVTVHANVDRAIALPEQVLAEADRQTLPELREQFPGHSFTIAGAAGEAAKTEPVLARNLTLAAMLIFVLLAIPLGSWSQPFVILAIIPFGLVGAVFGHGIMGINLDMMSFFGMAPLMGIVVNDALVMLDFINKRRARGRSAREAALEAGPARFRAIILTTVTTCAGVAPLIAERSFQAALLVPMAVSLAFGLAFATLVTLFLLPVVYDLTQPRRRFGQAGI